MNNKTRKELRPCFGTKKYSEHIICRKCQHKKYCEIASKKNKNTRFRKSSKK